MPNRDSNLKNLALGYFFLTALSACTPMSGSNTKDIFTDDTGDRRRKATQDEVLWTIYANGCTGHLLSPKYILVAGHCQPQAGMKYTSGSAILRRQQEPDISIVAVAEEDTLLDYAILEFKWISTEGKDQKISPFIATKASDVVMSTEHDKGDDVFTVGFPTDKLQTFGVTFAKGQLKDVGVRQTPGGNANALLYNIGTINGNSGGAVWRKQDNMLVTMTNGGMHPFQADGWDGNDVDDPNAWNWGSPMWTIYAQSAILKDIFPGGKNRFVTSTVNDAAANDLNLALVQDSGFQTSNLRLVAAGPDTIARIIICKDTTKELCVDGKADQINAFFQTSVGSRKIYSVPTTLTASPGLNLVLVGYDGNGKKVSASGFQVTPN